VPTGIDGLDLVLNGGVPAGRVTVLSGGPGSGKSTMGLQCLLHGAAAGRAGILVMFGPSSIHLGQLRRREPTIAPIRLQ